MSLATPARVPAPDSAAEGHPDRPARGVRVPAWTTSRRVTSVVGLLLLLVGMSTGQPALVLLALAATSAATASRWLPIDVAWPFGALGLVLAATAGGLAADALRVDLLVSTRFVQVVLIAVAVLGVALSGSRGPAGPGTAAAPRGARLLAFAPAFAAMAIGLAQELRASLATSWAFFATDFTHHLGILSGVQRVGSLDYATDGYPRAWHMLLAVVAEAGGAGAGPAGALEATVELWAAATWLAFSVMLAAGASLTLRLGERLRLPPTAVVVAATAVGAALLLLDSFVLFFLFMGAGPSVLAVLVLWCMVLSQVVGPPGRPRATLTVGTVVAGTAAIGHLWQALVLAAAGAGAVALLPLVLRRSGRAAVRAWITPSHALGGAVGLAAAAAVTLLPMLALAPAGGVGLAAISGTAPAVPAWLLVLAAAGVVRIAFCWRAAWAQLVLGGGAGFVLLVAVLLVGAGAGFDVTQYYPMKALWFMALFLAPTAALATAWAAAELVRTAWTWSGRLSRTRRLTRFTVIAVLSALAFAFVLPLVVVGSSASRLAATGDGPEQWQRRYAIAAEQGTRYAPAVTVPVAVAVDSLPDTYSSYLTAAVIRLRTGQPANQGLPAQVCADVAAVAGRRPAVVVTDLDPSDLRLIMERDGCADVPVVQLQGGSPVGIELIGAAIRRDR